MRFVPRKHGLRRDWDGSGGMWCRSTWMWHWTCGHLFCSNRWGENAWCYFSGLVSSRLESKYMPKIVTVFGSCEAEEKKKIIEIGIIQPLTGEVKLHFRQVTTQIWDTEMPYNPIIVRANLPTFREFGPIFDGGKSAECLNCSSTFHGYIAVKLKIY